MVSLFIAVRICYNSEDLRLLVLRSTCTVDRCSTDCSLLGSDMQFSELNFGVTVTRAKSPLVILFIKLTYKAGRPLILISGASTPK